MWIGGSVDGVWSLAALGIVRESSVQGQAGRVHCAAPSPAASLVAKRWISALSVGSNSMDAEVSAQSSASRQTRLSGANRTRANLSRQCPHLR